MRLHVLPQPIAFVRFIGVFVGCVGLSYLWAAVAWNMREWRGQWLVTGLIRSGVALLLACQIATGAMELGWIGVVLTDAVFATVQWFGISRGWLRLADES
jgi:H+/Cl- antiporter ClcA